MNITIDMLRAFRAAAETQNFTKAAEQTYMTQPAFSRLMSGLEKEWQVRLFDRTTRKVSLTPAGQLCYLATARMLEQYDHMLSEVEKVKRTFSGEMRVGCNSMSGMPEVFIHAMREMKQEYPGVRITFVSAGSVDLVPMIESGELDCGVVWSKSVMSSEKMDMMKLVPTHKYAILSSEHPLAERAVISLRDLTGIPIIYMKERETRTYQMVSQVSKEIGVSLVEAEPAENYDEMIMRVSVGNEAAISSFAYADHYYKEVVFRPISDLEQAEINGWRVLVWRRDNQNEGVQTLCTILERNLAASSLTLTE